MVSGSTQSGPTPWQVNISFVLAATTFIGALVASSGYLVPTLAVASMETLDVSAAFIGYQVTLVFGLGGVSSLISGGLVDRYGPCRVLQLALVLSAAGSVLYSVPDARVLTAGSALIGFCYGLGHPAAALLLARFGSPERMNFLYSFRQASTTFGAVGAGLMGPMIALIWGWQWAFLSLAVLSIGISVALSRLRPFWDDQADPTAVIAAPWAGLRIIFADRSLLMLCMTGFLLSVAQVGVMAFLVLFLNQDVGFTLAQGGAALSLVNLLGAGSRVFWGWRADRLKRSILVVAAMGTTTAFTTVAFSFANPNWPEWQIFAALSVLGLATFGWSGIVMANIVKRANPNRIAVTMGGASAIMFTGALVGPSVGSAILQFTGNYNYVFVFLASSAAIAAVLGVRTAFRNI